MANAYINTGSAAAKSVGSWYGCVAGEITNAAIKTFSSNVNASRNSVNRQIDAVKEQKLEQYEEHQAEQERIARETVSGILISTSSAQVEEGKTIQLAAAVTPSTALNQTIYWSSGNSSIASVSGGTVSGKKEGTAIITAKTAEGGFSKTCAVKVLPKPGFWERLGNWVEDNLAVIIIAAVILVSAVVVVATAGAATGLVAAIAVGAAKGALIGAATGAVVGATTSAVTYYNENGTLAGGGADIFFGGMNGMINGTFSGALGGGIGGAVGYGLSALFGAAGSGGGSALALAGGGSTGSGLALVGVGELGGALVGVGAGVGGMQYLEDSGKGASGDGTRESGNNPSDLKDPLPNHSETYGRSGDLPTTSQPHSSIDLYSSETGELLQRRFFDEFGRVIKDIDFTHGGSNHVFPHEHYWTWIDGVPYRS